MVIEPRETLVAYLRRALPDCPQIEFCVRCAIEDPAYREHHLGEAIRRTQRLLDDLKRAQRADEPRPNSPEDLGVHK